MYTESRTGLEMLIGLDREATVCSNSINALENIEYEIHSHYISIPELMHKLFCNCRERKGGRTERRKRWEDRERRRG